MDDRGLRSLVETYEAAIAELRGLGDPEVEQLIVRLQTQERRVLRLLERSPPRHVRVNR